MHAAPFPHGLLRRDPGRGSLGHRLVGQDCCCCRMIGSRLQGHEPLCNKKNYPLAPLMPPSRKRHMKTPPDAMG